MPDISLCKNQECTLKDSCYRMLAKPSSYQWYSQFTQNQDGSCDYYIYEPGTDAEVEKGNSK